MNKSDWSIWKDYGLWPFYSLRPSITKVNTILRAGPHDENLDKWPFQCEFEWSLRWVRRNKIQIAFEKTICVIRNEKEHVSTYNKYHYDKWSKQLKLREKCDNYNRNVSYYTFKSDVLKKIYIWNPYCWSSSLKKYIYSVEEEFPFDHYNSDLDINEEILDDNFNKYFIELNKNTLNKYTNYLKIFLFRDPVERYVIFCNKNNINLTKILTDTQFFEINLPLQNNVNFDYIDKIVTEPTMFLKNIKYDNIDIKTIDIKTIDKKIIDKVKEIYKKDYLLLNNI